MKEMTAQTIINSNNIIFNTGETQLDLNREYNPEGSLLRRAQNRMVEMLLWIKQICEDNNIEWMLAYGNILGAVRHKGFIPWDDDIDIALDRKNYEKLQAVLENTKDDEFTIQNHRNDNGYFYYFYKLRDKRSEYISDDCSHKILKYKGLQIDVFCIEEGVLRLPFLFMTTFVSKNIDLFASRSLLFKISLLNYKIGEKILIPFFRKLSRWFGKHDFYSIQSGFTVVPIYRPVHSSYIFPYKQIEFEGYSFPGPANPHKYLTTIYGHYMDLPPREKRVGHKCNYRLLK